MRTVTVTINGSVRFALLTVSLKYGTVTVAVKNGTVKKNGKRYGSKFGPPTVTNKIKSFSPLTLFKFTLKNETFQLDLKLLLPFQIDEWDCLDIF